MFFYFCCLSVDILTDFPALVVIPSNVRRNQQRNKEKLTDIKKGCDHEKRTRYRENAFTLLVVLGPWNIECQWVWREGVKGRYTSCVTTHLYLIVRAFTGEDKERLKREKRRNTVFWTHNVLSVSELRTWWSERTRPPPSMAYNKQCLLGTL